MKPQTRRKAVTPNSTTAGTTMPASETNVPKNKYIRKNHHGFAVRKVIRGKDCVFACGKHLTFEKARLIVGKIGELSETTNDKTEIMKGLIPFAKKHNIGLSKPRSAENKYIQKP